MRQITKLITCAFLLLAGPAPQDPAAATSRFVTWEVFVDTGDASLGAYQFEWRVRKGRALIVGVEGGEHPAFAEAPFYDEAALQRDRIIVGAFSTAGELPRGRTRVARVHLQIEGDDQPVFDVELQACAAGDGREIEAVVSRQIMRE